METCPTFYGKYRGEVTNASDPSGLGRVQVSVPDVLGEGRQAWAMPCVPFAGPRVGLFAIPPVGAKVWVEFEQGDPDCPIWSGCFWDPDQPPVPAGGEQCLVRVFAGRNFRFELKDVDNSASLACTLRHSQGEARLEADSSGMTLTWGKNTVKLAADGVSINGPNLKVLP